MARRLPGWLATSAWVVLGLSAVGLPTALAVALLDAVRRTGSPAAQRVLLIGLVLLAIVLVVAAERGITHAARTLSAGTAVGISAGLLAAVLLGVLLPSVGLVLVAVGVVLGTPAAVVGAGFLAYWRWQHGPRPARRGVPSTEVVRERAEERRAVVRVRHDLTRRAVEQGYVGPGLTRGR